MTSQEPSSSKLWKYDVFLSFRGEDTRNGFTGHLHVALKERGYEVFIDDGLKRGKQIREELFQAIEDSRISVIVFSKRYADSSWCLDELVKIMECREKLEREVLPIFYDVEPSLVRKQEGYLAEAFQKHEDGIREEKNDKERDAKEGRVKQWRKALTQAANLSGHHLQNGHEAKLIRKIAQKNIRELLPSTDELHVAKYPVGIDSRVQPIIKDLSSGGSDDVKMVGIWGMGGLGKTSVAKAIYNKIHHSFQFKCFLEDVCHHDVCHHGTSQHGLLRLQQKFVSDILQHAKPQIISSVDAGIPVIRQHLQRRRILVIIDNVDNVEQLNAIAGNREWFGPGSILIITTRDEHILNQLRVKMRYRAWGMNKEEALELFSWHTFENSCPDEEYLELSKKVVSYCGGLPLALQVLGSCLIGRPITEWQSHLEKLKRIPEGEIIEKLKISYDGLDYNQKGIFLDISCCFLGLEMDYVTKILDECGFFATKEISVLRERCLVTVEWGKVKMHDLIREMGKIIISEKFPTQPERWSRLWDPEAVTDVLTNKSGTQEIEGIALDLPSSKKASFSTKAFANMKNLRFLHLINVKLTGKFKHFPRQLRWLSWHGFPFKSMPKHLLNQPKLVALHLPNSKLTRGLKISEPLVNLKILDFRGSHRLKKSPDFSRLPNLEELNFCGCRSLSKIHQSIGQLERLTWVNFSFCIKLRYLPGEFYKLKSVKTLLLFHCALSLGEMVSWRTLDAWAGIKQFPNDLGSLISLQDLHIWFNSCCSLLPSLSGLSNLVVLRLIVCGNLRAIPDLPTNLEVLDAWDCPKLETMPDFSQMSNMRELTLWKLPKITEVPGLGFGESLNSMTELHMEGCTNLTAEVKKNILQGWTSCGYGGIFLDKIYDIPEWFEIVADGNKISFDVPQCDDFNFKGLTLCSVDSRIKEDYREDQVITVVNCTKHTTLKADLRGWPRVDELFWQVQLSNDKLSLQGGDKIVILLEGFGVKKTGVSLVWNKPLKENVHDGWSDDRYRYVSEAHPDWLYDESSPGPSHDASDQMD